MSQSDSESSPQAAAAGRGRGPESRARLKATVDRLLEYSAKESSSVDTPRRRRRSRPTFFDGELLAGRYRIVRFIASGGVGEVYEAEDVAEERSVALKTVRREVASDPDIMERFRRELAYARRIDHPNVCKTYEMDQHVPKDGGEPTTFLTMELLEGGTLEDLLGLSRRLEPGHVLPLVEQIVAGLAAAHAAGIVHRDLKAGNVMLVRSSTPDPPVRVVLTDFGLAHGALEDGVSQESSSLTRTGQIIGTPAYMAPEQLRGEKATRATDIYALGLLMYEMVIGARPFPGRNNFAAAVRRLEEDPTPPSHHLPELDRRWERTLLRCLERDPEDRFERVEEIVASLVDDFEEPVTRTQSTTGSEAPRTATQDQPFPRSVPAVLGLLLLLIAVVLGIRSCGDEAPASSSRENAGITLALG